MVGCRPRARQAVCLGTPRVKKGAAPGRTPTVFPELMAHNVLKGSGGSGPCLGHTQDRQALESLAERPRRAPRHSEFWLRPGPVRPSPDPGGAASGMGGAPRTRTLSPTWGERASLSCHPCRFRRPASAAPQVLRGRAVTAAASERWPGQRGRRGDLVNTAPRQRRGRGRRRGLGGGGAGPEAGPGRAVAGL